MSSPPWELLLPARKSDALLVLGPVVEAARAALAERRVYEDPGRSPFAAIAIFPGGPPLTVSEASRWSQHLSPGGSLLWWTPASRAAPTPAPFGGLHFLAGERSLWRPAAEWAEPLGSSGKLEWVRSLLGRSTPVEHELAWVVPGPTRSSAWLSEVLAQIAQRGGPRLTPEDLGRIDRTRTGLTIARLTHAGSGVLGLKIPSDDRSRAKLPYETQVLEGLRNAGFSNRIADALPRVLASGDHAGADYRLESWIPGRPGARLMYRTAEREQAIDSALAWIAELHRRDPGTTLSPVEHARYARETLARVAQRIGVEDAGFSNDVARQVAEALTRDTVRAVQGHGDYWLGNLILEPERESLAGVIDWTWADSNAPPLEDALHLLLYRKGLFSTFAPCERLAALLEGRGARRDRQRLASYARELALPPRALGALILVYWSRYLDTRAEYLLDDLREDFAGAYRPVRRVVERLGPRGIDAWGAALPAD